MLCQTISVWKYAYVLLQLIERLFFKSSNVKIKKIFKIEIKSQVREILFRIHNQFINFTNFNELCQKTDQNYYHYQRHRSKYSSFYFVFYRAMFSFFASFSFRFVEKISKWFQWCKNNKSCFKCDSSNHRLNVCRSFFCFDFVDLKNVFRILNLFSKEFVSFKVSNKSFSLSFSFSVLLSI